MKAKKCLECGKEFIPKNGYQKYCPGPHISECKVCGQIFEYTCRPAEKPKTCSRKCQTELQRITSQEKYGVDNVSQIPEVQKKISKSNKSEAVKSKKKATCLQKYGVDNVAKSEKIKEKQRVTWMKKYGVDNPMRDPSIASKISLILQSDESRKKYNQTIMANYGVPHPILIPEVREKVIQSNLEKYGVPFYVLSEQYRHPKISNVVSSLNKNFAKFLNENGIDTEFEFVLENKSYDLHVLNTNILIELDPTYTHSTQPNHWDKVGTPKNYHRDKSQIAKAHGYQCIHLFDWETSEGILNLLYPRIPVYARKLKVVPVSTPTVIEFLDRYHLQKSVRGQDICLGLVDDSSNLLQIMTFGKPRYNKNYEWELLRLCSLPRIRVIGGASKLFHEFKSLVDPNSVISYCDLSKFTGSVYTQLGFELLRINSPSRHWSKGDKHISDSYLLSLGYDKIFHTNYGKGISNEKLMIENGWRSVYDCGQAVYTWEGSLHESTNKG